MEPQKPRISENYGDIFNSLYFNLSNGVSRGNQVCPEGTIPSNQGFCFRWYYAQTCTKFDLKWLYKGFFFQVKSSQINVYWHHISAYTVSSQ